MTQRVAVIGAGAWGTALADVLGRNGHAVTLWAREADVVDGVNARHENARFLAAEESGPIELTKKILSEGQEEALADYATIQGLLLTTL